MLYKYIEGLSVTQMKSPYAFSKFISELLIGFSKSCLFIRVHNENAFWNVFWNAELEAMKRLKNSNS